MVLQTINSSPNMVSSLLDPLYVERSPSAVGTICARPGIAWRYVYC